MSIPPCARGRPKLQHRPQTCTIPLREDLYYLRLCLYTSLQEVFQIKL